MRLCVLLALTLLWPVAAQAQDDQTLADIRQELTVLYYDIQALKRELSTTGSPTGADQSGSVFDRVGTIEAQLQQLTARTEELDYRINRIVEDGTNRIGDLEFRLVELEGGDLAALGETTTLGGAAGQFDGDTTASVGTAPEPSTPDTPALADLAVGERADFEAAQEALNEGDYARTAALLAQFDQTYPGSPLAPQVSLIRGQALEGQGNVKDAARAYLDSFVADGTGPTAPPALVRLGAALGALGQVQQACLTLSEVPTRFPVAVEVAQAREEMARLNCN